jgi:hypothetical protein
MRPTRKLPPSPNTEPRRRAAGHLMGPRWGQRAGPTDLTRLNAGRLSSLTSANKFNPSTSPSEKREVAASIPALATTKRPAQSQSYRQSVDLLPRRPETPGEMGFRDRFRERWHEADRPCFHHQLEPRPRRQGGRGVGPVDRNFLAAEKSRCPNDTPSWGTLTVHENQLTMRVFHGPDAARHHPGHRPLDVDFLCCR